MAEINIRVNTESKDVSVTIDGVTQPDVAYVNVQKYEDYYDDEARLSVSLESQKKMDNGLTQRVCVYASETARKSLARALGV